MFPSQCCLAESPLSDGLIVEGEPAKVFQNLDALSRNNDIKDARIMIELMVNGKNSQEFPIILHILLRTLDWYF